MGELILTKTPVAANPYYIDELSLNIYTPEELSYYIYHNVWLLSKDFMSLSLCDWIGEELGLKELSGKLKDLIGDNAPITLFVSEILNANGYLTGKEIRDTVQVLSSFENKSDAECRKMRADRLFANQKIVDAVYEYENILTNAEDMTLSLSGDIRHNLGVCYSRLFFMKEAAGNFLLAYEANRNRLSLFSYLAALLVMGDDEKFDAEAERFLLTESEKERLRERVRDAADNEEVRDFSARLDRMRADFSERDAYIRELSYIISRWQDDYRKLCRI